MSFGSYELTCVFSDVHGNLPALESVLSQAQSLGADSYLFVGDAVSYGPFPSECIQRIAELKNIIRIRGNHDNTAATGIPEDGSNRIAKQMDMWTHDHLTQEERNWLLELPVEYLDTGLYGDKGTWMMVHGAPQDPHRFYGYVYELTYQDNLTYLQQHGFQLCFYGHTHVQFIHRRNENGSDEKLKPETIELLKPGQILLINAGSVGQPRDGNPKAAFGMWNRRNQTFSFHRLSYPIEKTAHAIREKGLPEDLVYRLEVGR